MILSIDPERLLDAIALALEQHVAPAVTQSYARSTLDAITGLVSRHAVDRDATRQVQRGRDEVTGLAAVNPQDADRAGRNFQEFLHAHGLLLERRERQIAERAPPPGEIETPLTEARLTAYLRSRFPQDAAIQARNLATPAAGGGFGKEIVLFDIVHGNGAVQSVVLRGDKAVHFTGTSVKDEYPLLRALTAAGYAAPRPLWLETSAPSIPRPFLVTEQAPGQPAGNYATYAGVREDRNSVLAKLLSALHTISLPALQLPGYSDYTFDDAALLKVLDYWAARYQSQGDFSDPVLFLSFSWLRDNVAHGVTESVLVHADFGFHNVLLDEHGTATLLDWEGAHVGSAAEDIAAAREALTAPGAFDRFLHEYAQLTGRAAPPPSALAYYNLFRLARRAVLCSSIVGMFNRGEHRDLRSVRICTKIYAENIRALCNLLSL